MRYILLNQLPNHHPTHFHFVFFTLIKNYEYVSDQLLVDDELWEHCKCFFKVRHSISINKWTPSLLLVHNLLTYNTINKIYKSSLRKLKKRLTTVIQIPKIKGVDAISSVEFNLSSTIEFLSTKKWEISYPQIYKLIKYIKPLNHQNYCHQNSQRGKRKKTTEKTKAYSYPWFFILQFCKAFSLYF